MSYIITVLIGIDVLCNAILGGKRYQTISCRIGESITSGGWACKVPWPEWFREHCLKAVYRTVV